MNANPGKFAITLLATAAGLITAALSGSAFGQQDEKLGKLSFPTSCDPKVQAEFERGVAMIHSYWFTDRAQDVRRRAAAGPQLRDRLLGRRASTTSATRWRRRRRGPTPRPPGRRSKRRARSARRRSASATGSRR